MKIKNAMMIVLLLHAASSVAMDADDATDSDPNPIVRASPPITDSDYRETLRVTLKRRKRGSSFDQGCTPGAGETWTVRVPPTDNSSTPVLPEDRSESPVGIPDSPDLQKLPVGKTALTFAAWMQAATNKFGPERAQFLAQCYRGDNVTDQ